MAKFRKITKLTKNTYELTVNKMKIYIVFSSTFHYITFRDKFQEEKIKFNKFYLLFIKDVLPPEFMLNFNKENC